MKLKDCRNISCTKKFSSNGTKAYCDKACYRAAKNIRQANLYSLIREVQKGLFTNYKLFGKYLLNKKSVEIDLTQAKIMGFDINAYYRTCSEDEVKWCCVKEYSFNISNKNGKHILTVKKN